jgi:subtilisin family serine protease
MVCSAAQAQQVVLARASISWLHGDVVHFVATNFADRTLSGVMLDQARTRTLRQEITNLCGSVAPAYLDAFDMLNGKSLPLEEVLGANADGLHFPACLNVSLLRGKAVPKQAVRPDLLDAYSLQTTLTKDARRQVEASLPASLNGPTNSVRAVIATPVVLRPLPGNSAANAAQQLNAAIAAASAAPSDAAAAVAPATGHIVSEVSDPTRSSIYPACPKSGTLVDAKLIRSALDWSMKRKGLVRLRGSASIYVVDNGFFGTDPTGEFGAAFPSFLFSKWSQTGTLVGPETQDVGLKYLPSNYGNAAFQPLPTGFAVTVDEAHGTHVAGLTLGGPAFIGDRDQLLLADHASPSIDMTIVNLGDGQAEFAPDSQDLILGLIKSAQSPHELSIVNMSVAYQGGNTRSAFETLFDTLGTTLFVVAAGNDSSAVDTVHEFPASLRDRANVIKVAAHDNSDPSHLAWFSNFGTGLVDVAAPGCGVASWKDATDQLSLSGTSQATPIVTFAAALLASLDRSLGAPQIKSRIMASGRLLGDDYRWSITSGSRLDIVAALLLYDDVVRVRVSDPAIEGGYRIETRVGQVTNSFALRCGTDPLTGPERAANSLWAFKREGADAELITGRDGGSMIRCNARQDAPTGSTKKPSIEFRQTGVIANDAVIPVPVQAGPAPWLELDTVQSVIFSGAG